MENTNDKTAVSMPEKAYFGALYDGGDLYAYGEDDMQIYGAARAEEARREGYEAGLRQGAEDGLSMQMLHPGLDSQRTAGGKALSNGYKGGSLGQGPLGPQIVLHYESRAEADAAFTALGKMLESEPVAEAAAQADGARMHDVVTNLREYASNPGYSHNDYADTMREAAKTIEGLRAAIYHYAGLIPAAPTAQPTAAQADEARVCSGCDDFTRMAPGADECATCSAAAPTAQPTPPDDELAIKTAPPSSYSVADQTFHAFWYGHMLNDLMQPPLANIDYATARYIWARAALRQPGAPADSLAQLRALIANDGHAGTFQSMAQYRTALLKAADGIHKSRELPPGVIALRSAFISHDSAAMVLFGRDDQVAWTAKNAPGHPKPVSIGQLREVLSVALGLPAGKKWGG